MLDIISSRRNDYCFLSREAIEAFTGVLPTVYVASNCRCPPTHPKINVAEPAKCLKNLDGDTDTVSRLNDTAHPTEFATDGDSLSYWLSEITENATIHINLAYAGLQVGFSILSVIYDQEKRFKNKAFINIADFFNVSLD